MRDMVSRPRQTPPGDIDPGELRSICREVIGAATDHHADLRGRGIAPDFTPEQVRSLFAEESSAGVEAAGAFIAEWHERVVPRLTALPGLRELISKHMGLVGRLHDLVREHPDFEALREPTPCLYCFRYVPNCLAERRADPEVQTLLDRLNREIVEAVRRGGRGLVTATRVGGRAAIRMAICSHKTTGEDVDAAFEALARWGRLLTKTHSARFERPAEMEVTRCSSESCSSPTEPSAT